MYNNIFVKCISNKIKKSPFPIKYFYFGELRFFGIVIFGFEIRNAGELSFCGIEVFGFIN